MNYTLIMLDKPILVSDENLKINQPCYGVDINNSWVDTVHSAGSHDVAHKHPKVIAGIVVLPKLDLSLIAEEIEWVDVERLADEVYGDSMVGKGFWVEGFKAAQSINEKKWTDEDMYDLMDYIARNPETKGMYKGEILKKFEASQLKEYQVEVEMEHCENCGGDGIYIDNDSNRVSCEVYAIHTESTLKITNNTIKVLKIIK